MLVRFVKNITGSRDGLATSVGSLHDVPDWEAAELEQQGYAEIVRPGLTIAEVRQVENLEPEPELEGEHHAEPAEEAGPGRSDGDGTTAIHRGGKRKGGS